jgi:hypothetical protein
MNQQAAVDTELRRGRERAFRWAFSTFMLGFLVGCAAPFHNPTLLLFLLSGIPAVIVYYVKLRGSFNPDNVIWEGSGGVSSSPALPQAQQTQAPPSSATLGTVSRIGKTFVFCANCSVELQDDSRFCWKCGSKQVATEVLAIGESKEAMTPRQHCVQGLMEISDNLAASFVAFSGKKPVSGALATNDVTFETVFDMIHAGFEPSYGLSAELSLTPLGENEKLDEVRNQYDPALIDAIAIEMRKDQLFDPAFRDATAFLCFYMNEFSRQTMTPEDGDRFNNRLQSRIANLCAGQLGFDREPRKVFDKLQELIHLFVSCHWVNVQAIGKDDCLGKILNHLSLSQDGQTRYAFGVGSEKHVGCVFLFLRAMRNTRNLLNATPPTAK